MSIEVKNLSHVYNGGLPNESLALDDVSFDAESGCFLGIIGHTGSGKSTLLQHLNGLLKPSGGTILINDMDVTSEETRMIEVRRKVGLVFQYPEYQLFEETVEADVSFGPKNLGLAEEEISRRVIEALELVGLNYEEVKDTSPFELSGGQKRRVAIAGVIAMKPEVLVLDEPTAGLNPKAHRDVLDMVKEIHRREKNITVLVSHNMNDIAALCDKVLVMDHGQLLMEGTPAQVFSREEELKSVGLALPDSMEIVSRLRSRGMNIEKPCLTIEDAAEAIAEILK